MFDVKTMKVSVVMAKMAGTESTAKITSATLTSTSTRKSGVRNSTGFPDLGSGSRTTKRSPRSPSVIRNRWRMTRSSGLDSTS